MKERIAEAMPRFFDEWCSKFNPVFSRESQLTNFKYYLGGLLGDSERKNIWAMTNNIVDGNYHSLHHFIHDSPWSAQELNERRLQILSSCRQTRIKDGFDLIIDDSGHRKSGSETAGVGRQYIGQIGKIDNGVVTVTSHAYDGVKGTPLDLQLYKHATSLEQGKEDPNFLKKPEIAKKLITSCIDRGFSPGLILLDAGYGNNTNLLKEIEELGLKYVAAISKTRNVYYEMPEDTRREKHRIEDVAKTLAPESFKRIELKLDVPRPVWVVALQVYLPKMSGKKTICIQMNASTFEEATEMDYFITNEVTELASAEWIAHSYSRRNWVEVFYREAKGWLGMTEYQVRDERSVERHWAIVFAAHSFIQYHQLTGGLRRWSTEPLLTFHDALTAFKNAVEFMVVRWISWFPEVFAAHRSRLGLVWH